MKNILVKIGLYLQKSAVNAESRMIPFATFGLIASLSYYFINIYSFPNEPFNNLLLRVLNSIFWFITLLFT